MPWKTLVAIAVALLPGPAYASSYPGTDTLAWEQKTEILTYRSCGCADSCWTAELRVRASKRLKASLRCDCTKLFATYPAKSAERELPQSCSAINDQDDKMQAITQAMKRLTDEKPPAK